MTTDDNGSIVKVTLRDVYDAVQQLAGALSGVPERVKDHEDRIRAVERKLYMFVGIFATVEVLVVPVLIVLLYHVFPQSK